MVRVLRGQADALRHLEVCEVKAWRYRATNQRVLIRLFHTGAEPVPRRYHPLELFAPFRVLAQFDHTVIPGEVDVCERARRPQHKSATPHRQPGGAERKSLLLRAGNRSPWRRCEALGRWTAERIAR